MKHLLLFISVLIFSLSVSGQTKLITAEEYDAAFDYALVETNRHFPFIFTFTSEKFENGILTIKVIDTSERQNRNLERQIFSTTKNGQTSTTYQLRTGSGENVYCSSDGTVWMGPQVYECPREVTVFGPRTPTSVECTLEERTESGKKVRVYRKYQTFEVNGKPAEFDEEIAVIGEDGLFITTTQTLGTVQPRSINTKMMNSWKLGADFEPIKTPENAIKPFESTPQTIRIFKN